MANRSYLAPITGSVTGRACRLLGIYVTGHNNLYCLLRANRRTKSRPVSHGLSQEVLLRERPQGER